MMPTQMMPIIPTTSLLPAPTPALHSPSIPKAIVIARKPRRRARPAALSAARPVTITTLSVLWLFFGAAGCIKAPDVILTDQKTALEQQAAGEFRSLENDLIQAGIAPKGEDIALEELEADNPDLSTSELGEVAQLYSTVRTSSEWLDELLVAGCVGESAGGIIVTTPERCNQELNTSELGRVVEYANLHRRQLWQFLQQKRSERSESEVRQTWRDIHLERVVCGAWVESGPAGANADAAAEAGTWEQKRC